MNKPLSISRKRLSLLLALSMIVTLIIPVSAIDTPSPPSPQAIAFVIDQPGYRVDDQWHAFDVAPYIQDNRTMVPVAHAARALGAEVEWDAATRTVTVTQENSTVSMVIGSPMLMKNGQILEQMDTVAVIKDLGDGLGRTMLPVSWLAKALDVPYQWDAATRTATFIPLREQHILAPVIFDEAGTFGPTSGTVTINNQVIIKASGVTLQNYIITGDLTIAEEVGDGDVTLTNLVVQGDTFIYGGGADSIYIDGGAYAGIIIQSTYGGAVRIVAVNVDGLEIIIAEEMEGDTVILEGVFEKVTVQGKNIVIKTFGETLLKEFIASENAENITVILSQETIIEKAVADTKTLSFEGEGTVKQSDGTEKNSITYSDTVTKPAPPLSLGGGGGGGSGTGGGSGGGTVPEEEDDQEEELDEKEVIQRITYQVTINDTEFVYTMSHFPIRSLFSGSSYRIGIIVDGITYVNFGYISQNLGYLLQEFDVTEGIILIESGAGSSVVQDLWVSASDVGNILGASITSSIMMGEITFSMGETGVPNISVYVYSEEEIERFSELIYRVTKDDHQSYFYQLNALPLFSVNEVGIGEAFVLNGKIYANFGYVSQNLGYQLHEFDVANRQITLLTDEGESSVQNVWIGAKTLGEVLDIGMEWNPETAIVRFWLGDKSVSVQVIDDGDDGSGTPGTATYEIIIDGVSQHITPDVEPVELEGEVDTAFILNGRTMGNFGYISENLGYLLQEFDSEQSIMRLVSGEGTSAVQNVWWTIRTIGEILGAEVMWDAETRTVTFTKGDKTVSVQVDVEE